jgi:hypothetical protein
LIHEETNKIIENLGDYGILAADLEELQNEIDTDSTFYFR